MAPVFQTSPETHAGKPQSGGTDHRGSVPSNQATVSVTANKANKAISPVPGVKGYHGVVDKLLKSVVQQIRTLRPVGAGGG